MITNGIRFVDISAVVPQRKRAAFASSAEQKRQPNFLDMKSLLTKPEDQGLYGTCMAWSGTTFAESLLWKLTGIKEEFTADEVYNIYLDAMRFQGGFCVHSNERMRMRGTGDWAYIGPLGDYGLPMPASPTGYNERISGSVYEQMYVYWWIAHYNDPEVRVNHYPDAYSQICDRFKNYVFGRLCIQVGDSVLSAGGQVYNELSPGVLKSAIVTSGCPVKLAVSGYGQDGHAVVMYGYDDGTIRMDSSWDSSKIYTISAQYRNSTANVSSDHYYGQFSDSRFTHANALEYMRGYDKDSDIKTVRILSDEGGTIAGVVDRSVLGISDVIVLSAAASAGFYFKGWSDGQTDNPASVAVSSVGSGVSAVFSEDSGEAACVRLDYTNLSYDISSYENSSLPKYQFITDDPQPTHCYVRCNLEAGKKYAYGTEVVISAECFDGFAFSRWSDGVADNPRAFSLAGRNVFLHPVTEFANQEGGVTHVRQMYGCGLYISSLTNIDAAADISIDFDAGLERETIEHLEPETVCSSAISCYSHEYELAIGHDALISGGQSICFGENPDEVLNQDSIIAVHFGNTIMKIQDYCCAYMEYLREVTFPQSLTAIGEHAFQGSGITEADIPSGVESVGTGAFCACYNLKRVVIPGSLGQVKPQMFCYDYTLQSAEIQNGISKIGYLAFYGCALTSLSIPQTVTYIYQNAFTGNNIKDLYIPDSVNTIEPGAFSFNQISSLRLSLQTKYILDSVFYANALSSVDLADSTLYIGENAFGYNDIRELDIPDGCREMAKQAFCNNGNMTRVYVPASISSIGQACFAGCTALVSAVLSGDYESAPSVSSDSFETGTKIYVKDAATRQLFIDGGWAAYADRITAIS